MTIYEIIARRDLPRALCFPQALTKGVLEEAVADAVVDGPKGDQFNEIAFRVHVKRPSSDDEVLKQIALVVERFAFYISDATVTKLAGDAVQVAIIDEFGDGAPVLWVATLAGWLTEELLSTTAQNVRRQYQASPDHQGCWSLASLPTPQEHAPPTSLMA